VFKDPGDGALSYTLVTDFLSQEIIPDWGIHEWSWAYPSSRVLRMG